MGDLLLDQLDRLQSQDEVVLKWRDLINTSYKKTKSPSDNFYVGLILSVKYFGFLDGALDGSSVKKDEQTRDTRCRQTKAKSRAETLPFKMFIKSENLFCVFLNQLQKTIYHFLHISLKLLILLHCTNYKRTPLVV